MTGVVLIALMLNALTVLLVLYLVYRADKAIGDFEPYLQDVEKMRGSIAKRGNEILEKTITVAQEMIRNAVYTSQKNIRQSESLQAEMENIMKVGIQQNLSENKQMIQKVTQDILKAYEDQFSSLGKEVESAGLAARQEVLDATKLRIAELAESMSSELAQIGKTADEKISSELTASQEVIKAYRDQKLKELDSKVYQVLSQVAKKTIGRTIDLSDHEELVMQALEKAKKENLL
ncbi:MAG: hypothetical protein WD187_00015 [Candidatus Woykebacteria bacterium]